MKVPDRFELYWSQPWLDKAAKSQPFRLWLNRNGFLSPHFTIVEAACHDGTPVPKRLKKRARDHAFRMEKLRHGLGDKSIPVISWYRTDAYNRSVHGAKESRHVQADACDVDSAWVSKTGRKKVQAVAEVVFANGGVGTYPGGSMHFDSRGTRARWSSFVGW